MDGQRLCAGVRWVGFRTPIAGGLLLAAAAFVLGAGTDTATGYGYAALWFALGGAGIGLATAPAMDAVLGTLPPERAGSGIAITMTVRYVGGALGVALLGSLLAQGYTDRLTNSPGTTGLPAPAAQAAEDSIAAALAAAARLGDPALTAAAQTAFLHGMTLVLLTCAAIAVVSAALTATFLPNRPQPTHTTQPATQTGRS